jgi:hypothetical protein
MNHDHMNPYDMTLDHIDPSDVDPYHMNRDRMFREYDCIYLHNRRRAWCGSEAENYAQTQKSRFDYAEQVEQASGIDDQRDRSRIRRRRACSHTDVENQA